MRIPITIKLLRKKRDIKRKTQLETLNLFIEDVRVVLLATTCYGMTEEDRL